MSTLRRARPGTALLVAVAVVLAAWPITTLVRTPEWYRASVVAVLVVAGVGAAARAARAPRAVVAAVQLAAGLVAVVTALGLGAGPGGLPTPELLDRLPGLVAQGTSTIRRYAAPAPGTPGLRLLLASLVTVVAVVSDLLAAGRRAPAAAGFALLVPFLVASVNTVGALPWHHFAAVSTAWLLLLASDASAGVRAFATRLPQGGRTEDDDVDAIAGRLAWRARLGAVLAVVAAVLAQGLLPQTPTRFVAEGLGRDGGTTTTGFASDVDVSRDLARRDSTPVLSYRADAPDLEPLAVSTATRYVRGHWTVDAAVAGEALGARQDLPPVVEVPGTRVPTRRRTLEVTHNALAAPRLATPGRPVRVQAPEGPTVSRLGDGLLVADGRVPEYTVTYLQPTPRAGQLNRPNGVPDPPPVPPETLDVDPAARAAVRSTLDAVVAARRREVGAGVEGPYGVALAVQEYLRGDAFTYSLTLAPTPVVSGRPLDPVSAFLATRRGYCVQFSTAMAMMAREAGIPARVRLGYLPGIPDLEGRGTVTRRDAHMWPELFLPGVGWTRFEPTPAGRAGDAPAYARPAATPPTTRSAATQRERPTAPAPTATAAPSATAAAHPASQAGPQVPVRAVLTTLATAVAVAALLAVVPAASALARRRRLGAATSAAEREEARWELLVDRLHDLGVDLPRGQSPRRLVAAVEHDSSLPGPVRDRLLARVREVERARYAPPPRGDAAGPHREAAVDPDVALVADLAASRGRGTRLRALLLPTSGLRLLRELPRGVGRPRRST